jgi:hypothetical protein
MHLLYCQNALVAAIHDDTAPEVPLSTYPAGTRIIPYDQMLNTLNRFGDPPRPPPGGGVPLPDVRQYQQPPETTPILIAYSSQCRYNYVTSGFSYTAVDGATVIPVETDRTSQALLANLAAYAATLAPTDPIDFTQNGVHYPITAQDAININNNFNAMAQKYRTVEASCLTDLNSATPSLTTYDQVDTQFEAVAGGK